MPTLLTQFVYLQILDVLSTLVFLSGGVREVNPLVRLLVAGAGSPLGGLLVAKLAALLLAGYCWRGGRSRLLSRVNLFYAALVAWNLVAFLVSGAGGGLST
ncbi:MAG: DUF5658 family protein [Bryobacteraceae bacterium]